MELVEIKVLETLQEQWEKMRCAMEGKMPRKSLLVVADKQLCHALHQFAFVPQLF